MGIKNPQPSLTLSIDRRGLLKFMAAPFVNIPIGMPLTEWIMKGDEPALLTILVDGGYIMAGNEFQWDLPTYREYWDPEGETSQLNYAELLLWLQEVGENSYGDSCLAERYHDIESIQEWLDEETAEKMGLHWIDSPAPGSNFLGAQFDSDKAELNSYLSEHSMPFSLKACVGVAHKWVGNPPRK